MPFTGSHPAAIVPLLRTGLVPSALTIGSMIPDLPYYVPIPWPATHSAAAVVGVDVLLGVIVFAVWHLLLAPAAVGLSPAALRDRLAPELPVLPHRHIRSATAAALVLVSLMIGAATHVLWDAFTHADQWGTRHIGWLAASHGPLPGYRWMQYAGGVMGAAVLAVTVTRWWTHASPAPGAQRVPSLGGRTTTICVALVGACLIVGAVIGLLSGLSNDGLHAGAFLAATQGGGAGAAAALLCALVCLPRLRAAPQPSVPRRR